MVSGCTERESWEVRQEREGEKGVCSLSVNYWDHCCEKQIQSVGKASERLAETTQNYPRMRTEG